jgi:hypothetical protein
VRRGAVGLEDLLYEQLSDSAPEDTGERVAAAFSASLADTYAGTPILLTDSQRVFSPGYQ